jgi:signal transduction histidine kinase
LERGGSSRDHTRTGAVGPTEDGKFPRANLHPFTLRFRGEQSTYEDSYQKEVTQDNHLKMRLLSAVAAVFYLVLAFFDFSYGQQVAPSLLMIRFGITLPVLLIIFGLTFTQLYCRIADAVIVFVMAFLAAGITSIMVVVRNAHDPTIFAAILLLQLGLILMLRPSFIVSLTALISMIVIFIGGDIIWSVYGPDERSRMIMYLILGGIISGIASYQLERSRREKYLVSQLYEQEHKRALEVEKLEMVREMARAVAHEFNNPLGAILGAYDYGVKPALSEMDQKRRDVLLRIPNSVQRMESLVVRLLNVTKLQRREYVNGISMLDLEASADPKAKSAESDLGTGSLSN